MQNILSGSLQSLLQSACEQRQGGHAQDLSELLFKAKSDVSLSASNNNSSPLLPPLSPRGQATTPVSVKGEEEEVGESRMDES